MITLLEDGGVVNNKGTPEADFVWLRERGKAEPSDCVVWVLFLLLMSRRWLLSQLVKLY